MVNVVKQHMVQLVLGWVSALYLHIQETQPACHDQQMNLVLDLMACTCAIGFGALSCIFMLVKGSEMHEREVCQYRQHYNTAQFFTGDRFQSRTPPTFNGLSFW